MPLNICGAQKCSTPSFEFRVRLGSAHTMILVELRGRLWLIDNRIVGGADGLCAGLDRQLGGYLGLGWAHRVIGGLPHFRLQGVDSPSH